MLTNPIAQKYAQAIFELAEDAHLIDQVGEELRVVADTIAQQTDLAVFFHHPSTPCEAKKDVIRKVFAPEIGELTARVLYYLTDKRRIDMLDSIVDAYIALVYDARGIVEAHVRSAMKLTEREATRLKEALAHRSGKQIVLTETVDPTLIGGLIVQMGDTLLDGSVKRKLSEMQDALMAADFVKSGVTDE